MLIDWFTVGAQILNFLILLWLLKRFLYRPILTAIDTRERSIVLAHEEAETKKTEAQHECDMFQAKNEAFDQQRTKLLSQAVSEAKTEGLKLLDESRKVADVISFNRKKTLEKQLQNMLSEVARRNQQEVLSVAHKILMDLAGISVETRMSELFVAYLSEHGEELKTQFTATGKLNAGLALVRSAFKFPSTQKTVIEKALNHTFSTEFTLQFDTAPALINGLELTINGWKVAWSFSDYLATLGKNVNTLLANEHLVEDVDSPIGFSDKRVPTSMPEHKHTT